MEIFPDDIVSEILTRLPSKSVHRLKSVSKRWYSIIHNPAFVASYISRHSSSSSSSSLNIVHRNILLSHSCAEYAAYAKEEGNELFKGGKFDEAISCYSRSIILSASAPVYANRALAYLKLSRFQEAEDDCTQVLSLDSDYLKAYGRRAVARKELGNLLGSMEDVEYALKLEPNNQGLKKQYTDIKSLLDKEQA